MAGHTAGRRLNRIEIWDPGTLATHAWAFGLALLMTISGLLDALVPKWSETRKSKLSVRLKCLAIEQNGLQVYYLYLPVIRTNVCHLESRICNIFLRCHITIACRLLHEVVPNYLPSK